jgi:branched-chain amino acid transport system substrate-binding protein
MAHDHGGRRVPILIAWLLAMVLAVGSADRAQADIHIGVVLPLSGPASAEGGPAAAAIKAEIDAVNAAGGIAGERVNLHIVDDQGDAARASALAIGLLRRGDMAALIGGVTTPLANAIADNSQAAGVPFVALATGEELTTPTRAFVFASRPSDLGMCEAMLRHLSRHALTRVALIISTDGVGKRQRAACRSIAAREGVAIVAEASMQPVDKDARSAVAKVRLANPTAIMGLGFEMPMVVLVRSVRKLEWNVPLLLAANTGSELFIDRARGAAEGVRIAVPPAILVGRLVRGDPARPAAELLQSRLAGVSAQPVTLAAIAARDAVALILAAMRSAGAPAARDPGVVRDGLDKIGRVAGAGGMLELGPGQHRAVGSSGFGIAIVRDGTLVPYE